MNVLFEVGFWSKTTLIQCFKEDVEKVKEKKTISSVLF